MVLNENEFPGSGHKTLFYILFCLQQYAFEYTAWILCSNLRPNLPGLLLPRKLKFFVNYFFGPLLFIGIAFSIYRQVLQQENLSEKWQAILYSLEGSGSWLLLVVALLMVVNWSIESLKWQVLLSHLFKIKFVQALKSVVAGVAFTMVTPNHMGEFIGRVFYVPDGTRIRAAALTLVGSVSQ